MIELIIKAIIYILPAYVANSSAVVFGGGPPIDRGKTVRGKRVLGDGKTFRGIILGVFCGTIVGVFLGLIKGNMGLWLLGFLLSLGALTGDLVASFLKRRVGVERGAPVPVLDQIDFVIGAILFASLFKVPSREITLIILVLTPFLHFMTNLLAYQLGIKDNPW